MRDHIAKENTVLYPMARQCLPPEATTEIDAACDAYDAERERAGSELERLAAELAQRHGD